MNAPETRFPESPAPGGTSGAIQCAGCHTAFVPRRKWQTFCSNRCRSAFHSAEGRKQALREAAPRMFEALRQIAAGDPVPIATATDAIGDLKAP